MAKLKDGTRIYGNAQIDAALTVVDVTVSGNLTIQGTTTTVDTTSTRIEDPIMELGGGPNGAALSTNDGQERGLLLHYYNGSAIDAFMGWHTSNGQFEFGSNATETSGNIVINTYGNVKAHHFIGEGDLLANINGANVTGTVANANFAAYAGNVTGNAQGNITSVGTLTGLTVGNATSNTVFGNGTITAAGLANVDSLYVVHDGNIRGNLDVGGNITGYFVGTVKASGLDTQIQFNDGGNVNASSGLTYTKTGSALTVAGNITANNISSNNYANITKTANVGNLESLGYANVTGTATVGNLQIDTGYANIGGNANVGNLGTGGLIVAAGNITGNNITSNHAISTVSLTASGNIVGNNISSNNYANITSTANVGNLETGGYVSAAANVSGGNLISNGWANVSGNLIAANISSNGWANIAGNVIANYVIANIRAEVGNLKIQSGGTVDGNLIPATNEGGNLGNISNRWKDLYLSGTSIYIGDQTITSNASGLSFSNVGYFSNLNVTGNIDTSNLIASNGVIANSVTANNITNTYVTFANATHVLVGNSTFTFNDSTGLVGAPNVTATGTVTANAFVDNGISNTHIVFANATHTLVGNSSFTINDSTGVLSAPNVTASGNVTANLLKANTLSNTQVIYANASNALVGSAGFTFNDTTNTLSTTLFTGTLTTNAQPNINSLGTLANLTVSGNATFSDHVITDSISGRTSSGITIETTGSDSSVTLKPTGNGTVDVFNKRITSVASPNVSSDAATKGYVDATTQGLSVKNSVHTATWEPLADAYAYANGPGGPADGVGATLTSTANVALVIDGHTMVATDRVLVKNETGGNAAYNGIYVVTDAGVSGGGGNPWIMTRAIDFDVNTEMFAGFTFVQEGTHNHDTGWVNSNDKSVGITIGTTAIGFVQFSSAGTFDANTDAGLSLSGTTFSVKVDSTTIDFDGGGNIHVANGLTLVTPNIGEATGINLSLTGELIAANVTANNLTNTYVTFAGTNGLLTNSANFTFDTASSNLLTVDNANVRTNLTAGNVTVGTGSGGNITGANVISANLFTGTLTTSSQPNITSLGNLTSLNVEGGDITVGNANIVIGTANSGYGIKSDNYWYANGTAIDFQTAAGNSYEIQFKSSSGNDLAASENFTFTTSSNTLQVTGTANVSGTVNAGNIASNAIASTQVIYGGSGNTIKSEAGFEYDDSTNELKVSNANITTTLNVGNIIDGSLTAGQILFAGTSKEIRGDADLTYDFSTNLLSGHDFTATGNVIANNLRSNALTSTRITFAGTSGLLSDNGNLRFTTATKTLTVDNIDAGIGNISTNDLHANTGNVTGNLVVGNNLSVTGNISGNVVTGNLLTGTLTTAAQPNVTSLGNLTSLTVQGTSTLGNIGNVKITGGSDGYWLKTDGAGNLSFAAINTAKISNGTSNVDIPTADGNITMGVGGNANVVVVSGVGANVTGYVDVTGNINGNNIRAGNLFFANANVDSNSSITGTVLVTGGIGATGNIYTGHSVGFANNNGGTASAAYIQFNATANSLDFIFN